MPTAPAAAPAGAAKSPFKFLDYFEERDEDRFGGREEDIQIVSAGVVQSRSFVIYGPSGSGKTSLIRAGVIPELVRRGYFPIYARTLKNPTGDFIGAVSHALKLEADAPMDNVIAALRERSATTPVVVVLDQFEEFFIRFRDDAVERDRLIQLLGSLLKTDHIDFRVLFSLRQDYLAELDDFRGWLPDLFDKEYRLRSLTAFGARQAIARQLNASNVPYEQKFLIRIVDYLEDVDYDPTLLQIVCSEVYRRAVTRDPSEVRLTAEDLGNMEDIDVLFHEYLNEFVNSLDPSLHLTAKAVLDALLTSEDTKRAATLAWLAEAGFRATKEDFEIVLGALARARLVRREELPGETWYELIHDRLVDVVKSWLAVDERFHLYQLARDLVSNEIQLHASLTRPEALLNAGQVDDVIAPQQENLALTQEQIEFLYRSAVFGRSEKATRYWADQLPPERRTVILTEMIRSAHAGLQHGAAAAAGWLEEGTLEDRCIELAMVHPSSEARAAAAVSVARMSLPAAAVRLSTRGTDRRRRIDALGVYYLHGGPLKGLGPAMRWRVRRRARRRLLQDHAEDIVGSRRRGAVTGAAAAVGWTYTAGLIGALLTTWAVGTQITEAGGPEFVVVLAILGGGGLAAILLGLVLGASGSVGARWFLTRRRSDSRVWIRLAVSTWRPAAIVGAIIALYASLEGESLFSATGIFLMASSAVWLPLFLGTVIAPLGSWSAGASTQVRRWAWPLLFCVGIPVFASLLIGALVRWVTPFEPGIVFGFALFGTTLVSLACFVMSRVGEAVGIAQPPAPEKTILARRLAVGTAGASAIILLLTNGPDTLPFQPFTHLLVADTTVHALTQRLGPGVPDVDYIRVRVDSATKLVEILEWPSGASGRFGAARVQGSGSSYLVPPGEHWLTVGPISYGRAGSLPYSVSIRTVDSRSTVQEPGDTTWTLAHFDMRFDSTRGTGNGVIVGTLRDARAYDLVELAFFERVPGLGANSDRVNVRSGRLDGYIEVANAWRRESDASVSRSTFAETTGITRNDIGSLFGPRFLIAPDTASGAGGFWRAEVKFVQNTTYGEMPGSDTINIPVAVRRITYATSILFGSHEASDYSSIDPIQRAFDYARSTRDPWGAALVCRRTLGLAENTLARSACSLAVELGAADRDPELYALLGTSLIQAQRPEDGVRYLDRYLQAAQGRPPEEVAAYRSLREAPNAPTASSRLPLTFGESLGELRGGGPTGIRSGAEYDLRLPPNTRIAITVQSSSFDPVIEVTGPGMNLSDDDGGGGTSSFLTFDSGPGGLWRVRVGAFEHGSSVVGPFRIKVENRGQ